jgi:cell fate regulator YaaT (PSP1 superfamily)
MAKVIDVRIGEDRGVNSFDMNDVDCNKGDCVIVELDRSTEFGRVLTDPKGKCKEGTATVEGRTLRAATPGDLSQIEHNRIKAKEALEACERKIAERRLSMNIIKSEYSFDSSKLIFFFTAEGRVDFRNLVKELARVFRVRIELKQIGVRDKAKIIGGYGVCGRELCCSSYMKAFHPLSIKMSKEQGLPLTPSRISGVCGRIKCCMAYEFLVYKEYAKSLPRVGEKISTPDGKGRVVDVNILKRHAMVDVGEGKISKVVFAPSQDN